MRIKLVHLLSLPEQEREIASVASLSPLADYGINYVQHINAPYQGLPPATGCRRPSDVSLEPGGNNLSPGHYGCYDAFRRAVVEEFTEDVDFFMICEADCIIESTLDHFVDVLRQVCDVLQDNNVGYFSFGDKNDIFRGPVQSPKIKDMEGCDLAYITDKIIGCQCILFPNFVREFLVDAFTYNLWDVSDIFLNETFMGTGSPYEIGIVNDRLANQHEGVSLIDKQKRKSIDNKTTMIDNRNISTFHDLKITRYGDKIVHDTFEDVFKKKMYEKYFKVEDGDIVVDVGSHVGLFSLSIDADVKKYYCLEPDEVNFCDLKDNIVKYGNADKFELINAAISDSSGFSRFEIADDMGVSNKVSDDNGEFIRTISFMDFIKRCGIDRIDFLKVDCEGGEFSLFDGDENWNFIKNNVKKIAGELHLLRSGTSIDDALDIIHKLKEYGFRVTINSVDGVDISNGFEANINYYKEVNFYAEKKESDGEMSIKKLLGLYESRYKKVKRKDKGAIDKLLSLYEFERTSQKELSGMPEIRDIELPVGTIHNLKYNYDEIFNKEVYKFRDCEIHEGDMVVDVGANTGIFAIYANSKGADRVVSYEPHPDNFEAALKNKPTNCEIHNIAIGEVDGDVDFYLDAYDGGHSFYEKNNINNSRTGKKITVACRSMDSLFQDGTFSHIDFLKIDVEGGEYEIFKSFSDENIRKVDKIAMEFHSATLRDKFSIGDLVYRLDKWFYHHIFIYPEGTLAQLYFWKREDGCEHAEEEYVSKDNTADKLMIVAHPDDEAIFAGNLLLKEKGWKVVSITGDDNASRRKDFHRSMKAFGVEEFEMWDYEDGLNIIFDAKDLRSKIEKELLDRDYEKIVTHNFDGEYGHIQHKQIHAVVSSIFPDDKLYFFGKGKRLSEDAIAAKLDALREYENQFTIIGPDIMLPYSVQDYILNEEITPCIQKVDEKVLIVFDSSSLGDNLAWMPYVEEFGKKNNVKVVASTFWNSLFEREYPDIEFIGRGKTVRNILGQYNIGWYTPWSAKRNPNNFRAIPLQQTATDILGIDYVELKPRISIPDKPRKIRGKYVCIGMHSTAQCKYWNYPNGWQEVVDYLNDKDYKVVHISKEGNGYMGNYHPDVLIDKTGDYSIEDRIIDLKYADMYIGIGSGLSWLSWAVGTPTILISGFSKPFCEPTEGIERLHVDGVCNGCFNDANIEFNKGDWNWCPRGKDFECSKAITPDMVIDSIDRIISNGR